jgi:hypothetical protein
MGEWRYSFTIVNLGIRWRWVASSTPLGTHCVGGWVGPELVWALWKREHKNKFCVRHIGVSCFQNYTACSRGSGMYGSVVSSTG